MSMQPYFEFSKAGNAPQELEIRFDNGIRAMVFDSYCVNPTCSCSDIFLDFIEIDENEFHRGRLFSIRIDITNWTINNKNIENEKVNCEALMDEFMNSLDDVLKEMLLSRFIEAKKHGGENPLQWFDELDIEDGTCFGFAEVFGDKDASQFIFKYKDTEYLVDDQYCSNPDCKCNEVVLTFVEIVPEKAVQEPKLVIRMPFGAGKYNVEFNQQLSKMEIEEMLKCFTEHMNNDFSLLRNRYKKMKEFGTMRLKRRKLRQDRPIVNSIKVGRNDPCPCGSGKKYKKCCGTI